MNKDQMELTLKVNAKRNAAQRRQQMKRAEWWFAKMRQVVDHAMEWEPQGARSEQGYLSLTARQS